MMRSYKFRIYPSKEQTTELNHHLWAAKELWNNLLQKEKEYYEKEKKSYTKMQLQEMTKGTELFSQTAQAVCHRLHNAIFRTVKERKQGKNTGFPRFKSFFRVKSLYYPQFGFQLENKLRLSPFGEISIKKHRQINGEIKTLTIKKSPSGKWFAIFCVDIPKPLPKKNIGERIGVDLGLINFAALSDGRLIPNPRHLKKYEERLIKRQRLLSRKKNGSKNRDRARTSLARLHEKVADTRLDFLHKTANSLISNHSLMSLEKLSPQKMSMERFGKSINDAGLGIFANILSYMCVSRKDTHHPCRSGDMEKAEEAGCELVFVNPENTSKECSRCKTIVEKSLHERMHNCHACGLSIDRDINAAINILTRATQGYCGKSPNPAGFG